MVAPATAADELSETGEFLDGVAAIVNEGVVLKSQLTSQIDTINVRAAEQNMQLPPPDILEEQILERLIMAEIQLQRADRIGLEISDEMLNRQIASIAQGNNIPFEEMPRLLAQDGIDYAEFRRSLREEITIEQLRRIEVGQSINVSEREIEQCIADLEGNVVANSEYELSHILLAMPEAASSEEVAETQALANQIRALALCRPLLLAVDGLPGYIQAFQRAFRSKVPRLGKKGRSQLHSWPDIVIVQSLH